MATSKSESTLSSTLAATDWMAELPKELHFLPLVNLALPGSHNSATFGIQPDAACAPDAPDVVKNCLSIPGFGEAVRCICHKWCVCQNLNFTQQLNHGIRYFDLRVSFKEDCEEFFFVHSLYGPKLSVLLESVSSFLSDHRKEVVLLDLNHFYDMGEEHHAMLLSLLITHFNDLLLPSGVVKDVTLSHMWDHGKQLIIFYQHDVALNFSEVWPASTITSPWPNTSNEEECITFLSRYCDKEKPDKFVVCQGVLTPNNADFLQLCGSLESLEQKFQPRILSWIKNSTSQCKQPLNIVIVDFVGSSDFINVMLALNLSRVGL